MATTWNLDPTHSEIAFKVKHMMITNVTGNFRNFAVSAQTEGNDFSTAKITLSVDVGSISTNNEQRDGHLKGGDFFDGENFLSSFSSLREWRRKMALHSSFMAISPFAAL